MLAFMGGRGQPGASSAPRPGAPRASRARPGASCGGGCHAWPAAVDAGCRVVPRCVQVACKIEQSDAKGVLMREGARDPGDLRCGLVLRLLLLRPQRAPAQPRPSFAGKRRWRMLRGAACAAWLPPGSH